MQKRPCMTTKAALQVRLIHYIYGISVHYVRRNAPLWGRCFFDWLAKEQTGRYFSVCSFILFFNTAVRLRKYFIISYNIDFDDSYNLFFKCGRSDKGFQGFSLTSAFVVSQRRCLLVYHILFPVHSYLHNPKRKNAAGFCKGTKIAVL